MGLLEWSERVSRVVQGRPRLEVENGRLVIEQHKSVRAYSSTCIRVDCPGGEVCIEGRTADAGSTFQSRTVGSGDDYKRNMEGQVIQNAGTAAYVVSRKDKDSGAGSSNRALSECMCARGN